MYHFVALVWNQHDLAAVAFAARLSKQIRNSLTSWSCNLSTTGLAVFSLPPRGRTMREYKLPGDSGVVLGRVFGRRDRATCDPEQSFTEHDAEQFTQTGGRDLTQNYWGGYVAFLKARNGSRYILRDCSGRIPCFRTAHGSVELVFSDIEDLAPFDLPPFTLNRHYLAAFVFSSQLQIRECGLNEVTEVLAGECLEFDGAEIRQAIRWDPRPPASTRPLQQYEECRDLLRDRTQDCVESWASTYDSILLSLSGGLDSAVVLGCLSRSSRRPSISCINLFTAGTHDDERRYARMAARAANVELIEQPLLRQEFDAALCDVPKVPKPAVNTVLSMLDIDLVNSAAEGTKAEALWTGQGGDHLFWQVADSFSAVDYVAVRGYRPGLLAAVVDAARITRTPYYTVLLSALRMGRSPETWAPDVIPKLRTHFVNPSALPENLFEYVSNPWVLQEMDGIPKGKQLQIYFLAEVLNRHRPNPGLETAFQHHPLLSQPLIELCLQIPIYLLLRGGRQRSMARDAFKDRVPEAIIRREDKGNSYARNRELLRRSERFLQELLLEGTLVSEGIVSRAALEPYLVQGESYRADHFWPLLACVAGEYWTRSWSRTALRIAA